jgi:hypothetical protein
MIDDEVKRLGLWEANPSRATTVDNFYKAKGVWGINETTIKGHKRVFEKMTWATALWLIQRERKRRRQGNSIEM